MTSTAAFLGAFASIAVGVVIVLVRQRFTRVLGVLATPLLGGVLLVTGYRAEQAALEEQTVISDQIASLAPTYAAELVRLGHDRIGLDTPADDPTYLGLIDAQKRWLGLAPRISDIYTFGRREDGTTVLLVDSETDYDRDGTIRGEREARTEIGEVYLEAHEAITRAFEGAIVFDSTPTTDRWGTWVSVYCPMPKAGNGEGPVTAVLGVDFPAAEWLRAADARRRGVLAVGALMFMVLVGAALAVGAAWRVSAYRAATTEILLAARARLVETEKLASLGRMLAGLSHEINNPINVIVNTVPSIRDGINAALALAGPASNQHAELTEALDDLALACDRIGAIHGDLRAFVRENPAARERLDLVVRARSAASLLLRTAPKSVRIEIAGGSLPPVSANATQIDQILFNLMRNGVEAVGERGIVSIRHETIAGRALLWLEDTGPGISPAVAARLFEPFFTTKGPGRGTGLGLAISRELAERNGGSLRLDSRPPPGALFVLEFPLAE